MKNTLLILLAVILCKSSIAHNDTSFIAKNQLRIAVGAHVKLINLYNEYNTNYLNDNMQLGLFSISYNRFLRKNDFHDITLNDFYLNIGNISNGNNTDQFGMGLSYTYNISFVRKRISKVQPYIGFGANMRYDVINNKVFSSTETLIRKHTLSMQMICTPRVNFNIKKHWSIDVSMPFDLLTLTTAFTNRMQPSLPLNDRKSIATYLTYIPTSLGIRVGVGYKF